MENKRDNKTLVQIENFIDRLGIIQNILNIYINTRKNIYVHIYTNSTRLNLVIEVQKKYTKIRTY